MKAFMFRKGSVVYFRAENVTRIGRVEQFGTVADLRNPAARYPNSIHCWQTVEQYEAICRDKDSGVTHRPLTLERR